MGGSNLAGLGALKFRHWWKIGNRIFLCTRDSPSPVVYDLTPSTIPCIVAWAWAWVPWQCPPMNFLWAVRSSPTNFPVRISTGPSHPHPARSSLNRNAE